MLSVQVDALKGIAVLEPHGALSKDDFERAAKAIDPHLEKNGQLNGILVRIEEKFPGWDSDSALGNVGPAIARHFVKADVRAFKHAEFGAAKAWASGGA